MAERPENQARRPRKTARAPSPMPPAPQGSEPQAPAPEPSSPTPGFPVVGIGASAGGLEAFTQLLENIPVTTGLAFVIVQHLDPTHESMLPALL